ncbi:MAG: sigma-70 family RNA polymerase sigma factor [Planctomycetes bacterium]|nr:sigma-70 family RNA polymerase sigma factor [Planctomycetota bacterium]
MSIEGRPDSRADEELMTLLRSGADEPLGVLVSRHGSDLVRFFMIRSRDPHAAQDLANETFYRVFAKARTFDPSKRFRPWFFTVALNVWRAWQRRSKPPEVPLQQLPEAAEARGPEVSGREKAARMLDQLSEVDREILVLRHYEGLKLKDIARQLGMSPGAVYTRLFRALEKLRRPEEEAPPP